MAETLTPMMQQYVQIKDQYKDCILFYRLGDFYEMFFDDAILCSRELEITLTGKNCGQEERAPMCGIPYHSVEGYLSKLVEKGYKVAICEQVEDPKMVKGLVRRDVIRIVTSGTNLNTQTLDEGKNNYLMSIVYMVNAFGVAVVDVTTGEFFVTEVDNVRKITDEINKYEPSEIVCNDAFYISGFDIESLKNRINVSVYSLDQRYFDDKECEKSLIEQFGKEEISNAGLKDITIGRIAAGSLMLYLHETQKNALVHLNRITPIKTSKYMALDNATRRNLELVETMREKQKKGSLLWVLDKTKTAMGARLLRKIVEQPLVDKEEINKRLDAVEEINKSLVTRDEIREYLNPIYDLERLLSKVSYKSVNPRDLVSLKSSLKMVPPIKTLLSEYKCEMLKEMFDKMDTLEDISTLIENAIIDEPALNIKEGGIIKDGYNKEIDKLRAAKKDGKSWLADIEAKERDNTGIKNLKIKFNKVFGYYLEVTNSYKDLVPSDWTRKQTLANAERYITPELKELEELILGAEEKINTLEYELFNDIRDKIEGEIARIQTTAKAIAYVDVFCSLALVAYTNNYVKPIVTKKGGAIEIKDGRHPVVEKMIDNNMFVVNDTYLDNKNSRVSIITGPNMAGKSTYMRQTALIVLMAQIGSFVPASHANISIADRIFTRVGASDDLASGQSTFMVEMNEVANILKYATKYSLLILDEIGRGTSTFDGLSIAWAVIEHIANTQLLGAKTLFATHYHELTELEGKIESVKNYCIAVKESGEDIIFLRKIVRGGADKSYGIQVARLAGVPENVLKRAKELVEELSTNDIAQNTKRIVSMSTNKKEETNDKSNDDFVMEEQLGFEFDEDKNGIIKDSSIQEKFEEVDNKTKLVREIKKININKLTPIEAMNVLFKLQEMCE